MKKIATVLLVLALVVLMASQASARKGVGLKWSTETEIVNENSEHCIEYGVYNPWDEDVRVSLGVGGELQQVVTSQESEVKLIPAHTYHNESIPVTLCFTVPKVYKEDCMLGDFLCEQKCEQDQVVYNGEVVANEVKEGGAGAMGSATALGVSTDLKLKVNCVKHGRDWSLVYIVVIVVVVLLLIGFLYKRKK